jgi:hypothetical protein
VRAVFQLSETELDREVAVRREARSARRGSARACLRYAADDLREIRFNRRPLLETLGQLRDEYLASELLLPRLTVQTIDDHPGQLRDAAQHVRARVTGL